MELIHEAPDEVKDASGKNLQAALGSGPTNNYAANTAAAAAKSGLVKETEEENADEGDDDDDDYEDDNDFEPFETSKKDFYQGES